MIDIGPAKDDFSPTLLGKPGAFVWWYVDVVDESGSGAVLLWSFGLPFLPGASGREPRKHPALSLAVYERGRAQFYVLQELDPARCMWGDRTWALEDSRITRTDADGRVRIDADLALPIPGGLLATGTFALEGPIRVGESSRNARHSWEPIALGGTRATLTLVSEGHVFRVNGSGYFDRNGGEVPLAAPGVRSWRWGRVSFGERTLVFTQVEHGESTRARLFDSDGSGRFLEHAVTGSRLESWRPGGLGPAWPQRIVLDSALGRVVFEQDAPLDAGPFYVRSPVSAVVDGRRGRGLSEHVLVDRLDRPHHRPFVDMRVQRTVGPNSFWLPLFSGPREGRLRRLLRGAA
jgi:carotenoid 1,2-hydratase